MAKDVILSLIHAPDNPGDDAPSLVDIVCVHGIGGHPYLTWAAPKSSTFWSQSLLPKDVPELRFFTFGYGAQATHLMTDIVSQRAQDLLKELVERRGPDQKIGRELIFVAHSLGGVIVKQALAIASKSTESAYRKVLDSTLGIIFLSTPHSTQAKDITRILKYAIYAGGARPESYHPDLLPQSVVSLQAIQETFEQFHLRQLLKIHVASFFEELPVPGFGLVVDEISAVTQHFTRLPLHANHETICKFGNCDEPNYQRVLGELKKILRLRFKEQSPPNSEVKELLRRLQIDNGSGAVKSAFNGTCDWVFQHSEYLSWLKEDRSPLLWLCGTPGAGKSTLVKHIIQNLKEKYSASPETITAYYFFHYSSDIISRSASGLFRSLLFQLLSQNPSAMSDFVPLFQPKWNRYSKLGGSGEVCEQWLANDSEDLLNISMVRLSNIYKLYIIVDGLDECLEEDAVRVLSFFQSIHSKALKNAVRFCVSTRLYAHLEPFCNTQHQKILLQYENGGDIRQFTRLKLEGQLQPSNGELQVLDFISRKASGIFLWVSLVLDLLAHSNGFGQSLEEMLWELPSDLETVYLMILDRFTQSKQGSNGLARKLLTWITYSRRSLSIEELQEALRLDATPHSTSGVVPVSLITDGRFPAPKLEKKGSITQYCWGLVEIRDYQKPGAMSDSMEDSQIVSVVHLVHQTAYDFLDSINSGEIGSKITLRHGFSESPHMYIANACVRYLSLHSEASPANEEFEQQSSQYPLLHYATTYWMEHAKLADQPSSCHLSLLQNWRWPSNKVIIHWAKLYSSKLRDNTLSANGGWTVLHAAAAFGLYNLALAMHEVDKSVFLTWDVGDASGRTPLSLAVQEGHVSFVRLLIQEGASIKKRDIRYGLSPLHWAAAQGHQKVVELLLEAGADVDDHVSGSTPLAIAAARDHQLVVKMLLKTGADPNLMDKQYGQVPLHFSAAHGNAIVVSHLLAYGANPNILDNFTRRTPLYYAIVRSCQEIVRLLLDHGASIPRSAYEDSATNLTTWADRVSYALLQTPGILPLSCPQKAGAAPKSSTYSSPSKGRQAASGAASGAAKQSQKVSHKRNREDRASEGDNGDDGSGDDSNKHPRLNSSPPSVWRSRLRLACPYFKNDPARYSAYKTCRGPDGWPDVHRLKQHLYERHFAKFCQRCRQIFQEDQDLVAHATAKQACSSRTKKKDFPDQLEYWKDVYHILFPEVETTQIPSPFYQNESINCVAYDKSCAQKRLNDTLLKNQLLDMVPDPRTVENILNLINSHQANVIRPAVLHYDASSSARSDAQSALQSQVVRVNEPTVTQERQTTGHGIELFSYDETSFLSTMGESRPLQPGLPLLDSGFYSGSSAATLPDTHSQSLQSTDGAYAFGGFTSDNPEEVQRDPASDAATTIMNHAANSQTRPPDQDHGAISTGIDPQLLLWNDEVNYALEPGPEHVPNSQTVNCDEQPPPTQRAAG